MNRVSIHGILLAGLLVISVWNAMAGLYGNLNLPTENDWTSLAHDVARAKTVLLGLPDLRVEYRTEGASDTYDAAAFYRLQYALAPVVLRREAVENRYVLVEFWMTRNVVSLPDLILLEDLGHGFGLYRRP